MDKRVVALGTALAVAGCTVFTGCTFTKAKYSGEKKLPVSVYLVSPSVPAADRLDPVPDAKLIELYIDKNEDLKNVLYERGCRLSGTTVVPPAAIPVIIAAGKLVFDLYMDTQLRKQEELKKAAQSSYSERLIVSGEVFKKYDCALIFRGLTDSTNHFVALIQFVSTSEKAFQIQPLYIRVGSAVAVTSEGESGKSPSINVSFGISVKALAAHPLGVASLYPIGEGAVSVPNVEIGPKGKAYVCIPANATPPAKPVCPTSELVAYPEGKLPASITFSITETGNVGIDLDQNTAELRAIKEAVGPVIKDTLKELVK